MLRRSTAVLVLTICSGILLATPLEAQEARTHTVSRGETLWDLSRSFYGNPFDWRRIYQANQDRIEDPHWIYPGQVLTIPGIEAREGQVTAMQVGQRQPDEPMGLCPQPGNRTVFYEGEGAADACPPRSPEQRTIFYQTSGMGLGGGEVMAAEERPWMAIPQDIFYSAAWLVPAEVEGPPAHLATIKEFRKEGVIHTRTTAQAYEELRLELTGDRRPSEGDLLQTFRMTRTIDAGRVATPTGLLTVTELTDSGVVAVVSNEYARVQLGDMVRMAPPFDLEPGFGAEPYRSGIEGRIIGFEREQQIQGLGHVGFVDVGRADGLQVGDELEAMAPESEGWSDQVAGRLQIVNLQENRASFRIVGVIYPVIGTGTRVRVSGRLP